MKNVQVKNESLTELTEHATGKEWLAATQNQRRSYVEAGCRRCAEAGVSVNCPSLLEEGISEYFRHQDKLHHELGDAFGEISSTIVGFGHYRRLTDSMG